VLLRDVKIYQRRQRWKRVCGGQERDDDKREREVKKKEHKTELRTDESKEKGLFEIVPCAS
jgi:hypothetical protein